MFLVLALYVAYVALVVCTAPLLPDKVASHFGLGGAPDAWMSKQSFLITMLLLGIGLPLLVIGIFAATTYAPEWMINIPNKEYWFSPDRVGFTRSWIFEQGFWLSCMLLSMFIATHWFVIEANRSEPVRLPENSFLAMLACFVIGMGIWTFRFLRLFYRAPAKSQ
jgi:uncharacterized membrane protein